MTSSQARKGGNFERDVVAYLRALGFPEVERAYGAGRPDDVGDIDGIDGWCLELKNHAKLCLAEWCDEAMIEALNAKRPRWAVIHKRRRKPISAAYVTMDLATFAGIVAFLRWHRRNVLRDETAP